MTYEFTAKQLKDFQSPGVYFFWARGKIVYIGASNSGLGRPLAPAHKMRHCEEELTLTFVTYNTANEAFEAEIQLIKEHQPKYNSICTGGKGKEPVIKTLADKKRLAGELPSIVDFMRDI